MTSPIGATPAPITLGHGVLERTHDALGGAQAPRPSAPARLATATASTAAAAPVLDRVAGQGVNALAETVEGMTPLDAATMERLAKLDEAAKAFEQVFVRQLLKSANLGSGGNYASMTTDALSQGVSQGGGMGLARMIRDTLIRSEMPEVAKNPDLASALQSLEHTRRPQRIDT